MRVLPPVEHLKNDDLLPKMGCRYSRRRRWPRWYRLDRVRNGELLGSLHAEYTRCGKMTCKCRSGAAGDLHGPYWFRRWRDESGKQRKAYVKRSDLDHVRAAIERREARLSAERETRKRHMRRGEYAWKAQNPGAADGSILGRVLRNVEPLQGLRENLRR